MKRYALISLMLLASCAMLPRNAPDEPGEVEKQEPKTESSTQYADKPKPRNIVSRPHGTAEKPKAVLPPPPQCEEPETNDRRKVMLIKLDCLLKSSE